MQSPENAWKKKQIDLPYKYKLHQIWRIQQAMAKI